MICDGGFEGSVVVHIVRKNILLESVIRDVFFELVWSLVCFSLWLGLGFGFL